MLGGTRHREDAVVVEALPMAATSWAAAQVVGDVADGVERPAPQAVRPVRVPWWKLLDAHGTGTAVERSSSEFPVNTRIPLCACPVESGA
ncbi:hypothetical protein [Nocardia brevicatena]|uniref:hypothetical protein n=1 Tax=Nocardia brevicatena TaxID=37327 RepID=UPI0005943C56|nr:hypothetical protein [Nocardia brevicatena]